MEDEIFEKVKLKIAISEFKGENDMAVNKKRNFIIKKGLGIAACFAILFSGIVYAKDIENYFKRIFTNSTEAIDKAVENGYIQEENMNYVYDKDIGVKVDNLVLDELNLAISFNFETKKENIKSIRFNDFTITNDNNKVVFRSEFKYAETLDELPIYNSVNWGNKPMKLTDTTFLDSILLGLRPEKEDFKELYFDVKSVQLTYTDDTQEIIEGTWKFDVVISDEMRKSTTVIYNMIEDNEYIESCTATMSNTGTIIELNSKVEIPDISYEKDGTSMPLLIHLDCNGIMYETREVHYNESYMKIKFEDVSNFVANSDKLELYLDFFDTTVVLVRENK